MAIPVVSRDANAAIFDGRELKRWRIDEDQLPDKLLTGRSSKQIARELDISPRTMEAHRQNVLHKLKVGAVKELIGLLAVPDNHQ